MPTEFYAFLLGMFVGGFAAILGGLLGIHSIRRHQ